MTNKMHVEGQKVVLRRCQLTSNLFIEEVAVLDEGLSMLEDGTLPKERYGVMYRIALMDAGSIVYIEDWYGHTLASLENKQESKKYNLQSILEFFAKKS